MITDATNAARELIRSVQAGIKSANLRSFNDLNKEAGKYTLNLYALASDNLPPVYYQKVCEGIATKTHGLINVIFNNYVGDNIQDAIDYVNKNLGGQNNAARLMSLTNAGKDALSTLNEQGIDIKIDFSANPLDEAPAPGALTPKNIRTPGKVNEDLTKRHISQSNLAGSSSATRQNDHTTTVRNITITLRGENANKDVVTFNLMFNLNVQLLVVPAEKLIGALSDAKNRGILEDFLDWRAGKIGWKDFAFNVKALKREATRSTSLDPKDRIISELMSKRGLTIPVAFSDLSEFRNFTIVLDISDIDRFQRETGTSLMSTGMMAKVFKNFNISSLIVIDPAARKASIYDSDKPTRGHVISSTMLDATNERGLNMFERMIRGS